MRLPKPCGVAERKRADPSWGHVETRRGDSWRPETRMREGAMALVDHRLAGLRTLLWLPWPHKGKVTGLV